MPPQPEIFQTDVAVPRFTAATLSAAVATLHRSLRISREAHAAERRAAATEFSVFDFIKPNENALSDILAFLLDPTSTHGQGPLFLEKLLNRVGLDSGSSGCSATVARESLTYAIANCRRRIDIVVTLPDLVLGIETKTYTGEGWDQIGDYCKHLSKISGDRFCLLFLTRTGERAASIDPELAAKLTAAGQLLPLSWGNDLSSWLDECRADCEAPKIRHFLEDFKTYIAAYLATAQPGKI